MKRLVCTKNRSEIDQASLRFTVYTQIYREGEERDKQTSRGS